jgi:hypothetical protein
MIMVPLGYANVDAINICISFSFIEYWIGGCNNAILNYYCCSNHSIVYGGNSVEK